MVIQETYRQTLTLAELELMHALETVKDIILAGKTGSGFCLILLLFTVLYPFAESS
jgi:hypothetical protein